MSVSTPSTNVHDRVADDREVLEVELRLLDEPHALLARDRRQRPVLDRRGPLAEAREHRVDIELVVGHRRETLPSARHEHTRPAGEIGAHEHVGVAERARPLDHRVGLMRCELAHERAAGTSHSRACASRCSSASRPVGPDTSAPRGSKPATSSGRLGTSCSATYGGFDTMSSSPPRSVVGQRVEPRPDRRADPGRRAAGDVGARHVERVGAHVGGPHHHVGELGVEGERDRAGTGAEVGDRRGRVGFDQRQAPATRPAQPAPLRLFERDLHDLLGLRAAGSARARSTMRSSPRNDHEPSTYCSGSPAIRRSTSGPRRVERASRRRGRRRSRPLGGRVARHVLDEEARLGLGGRDPAPPTSRRATSARTASPGRGRRLDLHAHAGAIRRRAGARVRRPRARRRSRRDRRRARGRARAT